MSNRLKEVSDLFLETQGTVTDSIQNWQDFLTTASRLSKYNFNDQLLIFAQRPNATACANMELWNKKMNRWIKTGSKGIALIRKNTGEKPRLEYVFDFADTRQLQHGKTPYLWEMREEFHAPITEKLSQMYGEIPPNNDFANTLMEYCARATGENYREFLHDLSYDLEDSFLEGFDEMNVDIAFRNVITVSTQYMVLSRCGFNPANYLDEDDFRGIFEFNTLEVLSHLGNALNRVSGELLLAIGDLARNIDLEKSRHSLENSRERTYTKTREKFTTLNRNSENIEEEKNNEQHTYLQSERGSPHSEPTNSRGQFTGNSGQIRDAQGNPPERPQEWHLHEDDDAGHPVGTLGGDRPNSTGTGGWIDGANDDSTGRKRELESPGSDALGADGNEHQSTGGGGRAEGFNLQLTPQKPSLFPTVLQQINTIIEAKAEEQSSVFALFDTLPIPSHVVDKIIAAGSNELRDTPIIAGYMAYNHEISENAAYIASHYGTGGKGFEIDGEKYSLWYDKNGLQIGRGNTVELATSKIHLTWEQVAGHIRGLLETGEYVTADALANSKDSYLTKVAESYSFMYRERDDDYQNEILDNIVSHFIYPECTNTIKSHFADKDKLANMVLGLQQMDTDHKNTEGGIMRFRYYSPEKTLVEIKNLGSEPVEFPSNPDFKLAEPTFITEDELNHIYIPSSRRIDTGCIDIYAFYKQGHTDKEKADFLKNKHGWSGYGVSNVNINHSAKGTTYTKGSLTNPYAQVSENWAQISKRIGKLIAENRYLKQQDMDYIPTYEKQLIAREIHTFYSYAPKDAEKPYTTVQDEISYQYGNYEKHMEEIAAQLDKPQFVADLAEKMENILSHTLSDERGFQSMEKALADVKSFRDGSFSIFHKTEYKLPEKDLEDEEDFDEPQEPSIEQMAKNLERKRQTPFVQNDYGQLSLDFSPKNEEVSEILQENGFAVSDELIAFASENLDNPTPSDIAKKVEEILTEDETESETAFDFDNGSLESTALLAPVIEPQKPPVITDNTPKINYTITDDALGTGGTKEKFNRNILAIETLQKVEAENRLATPEEQEILSQYVGWGGMPEAFDDSKTTWTAEYATLKNLLSDEEYKSARASTLNAHYTAPVVIRSMYEGLNNMGIPQDGNFIDPALGTGHFIGMLPENLKSGKMYGTELDSLTGRIAKQLYPNADIQIKGFEKANYPDNFFDVAVGNVPFGNYKLNDKRYDKQNFLIHDYFFAKTLDKVRVGGVVAFITSKGTMDKQSSEVRKYLAQRADLLGAIRLPNTAFKANAGTEVTSDILFFQKRDHAPEVLPSWVDVMENADGIPMNQYFIDNPQMIMGKMEMVSGPFGMESTCSPYTDMSLADQLKIATTLIQKPDSELLNQKSHSEETDKGISIAATADVRNFSYTLIDDKVYYRENSRMNPITLSDTAFDRLKALIAIRDKTRDIIEMQLDECSDERLQSAQAELNTFYDSYNKKFGLINSKGSKSAFVNDVSYPLLCSLEKLDEGGNLAGKADMFTKRTIKQGAKITSVDTPSEALAVSISEKACVDIPFMAQLLGGVDKTDVVIEELRGVIFKDPLSDSEDKLSGWQTADEYLSGNVREKLAIATLKAETNLDYAVNVEMLTKVQPKDLSASEIDVRIGATWIEPKYYSQFLYELLGTPRYLQGNKVDIKYSKHTGEWNISGKNEDRVNPKGYATYGTKRKNAYAIIEDSLNLRDSRIYDTVIDDDGKEKRVLNGKETTLAQQKQEAISEAFKEWIWKDPERREVLAKEYNKIYNSTRPREFDGQHIKFDGMNPTIRLNPHQSNAVARTLYGGNTLLAHCVGAGKTYTMIASAMESKRLGLSQKSLFVVPNHLTEQMGSDIYELYPGAKVLVATKKDFEPANRKEFCSRIATGDFDIVVIGHSQFEKIPLSVARQEAIFEKQIDEIMFAIQDAKAQNGERYTIKQLEKTQKSLETRLEKLSPQERKDSVVTFEELGVDKLYVDEGHMFKNLFLQTKMRNVAGIGQSEAQKSTDMFTKCRYMDELTGGKGTIFATGTPVSNSMTVRP